ncbi:serine hydrolase, partial [Candidatus Woesearchaeota archaeon]|nr:serine hydrolase [Candidatus Woesearchaeota archaeon]
MPNVDFGLLTFGFTGYNPFSRDETRDGEGSRRENADITEKHKSAEPLIQVSSPSGPPLEEILVPGGIGALEIISHSASRKAVLLPVASNPYLTFDFSTQIQFAPQDSATFNRTYMGHKAAHISADYAADEPYTPPKQQRQLLMPGNAAPYTAPILLVSPSHSLFAADLIIPNNAAYGAYTLQASTTIARLPTAQPKQVIAGLQLPKYAPSPKSLDLKLAKPEIGSIPNTLSKPLTDKKNELPAPKSATLEANIRSAHRVLHSSHHSSYNKPVVLQSYKGLPHVSSTSLQTAKSHELRLEARARAFSAGRVYIPLKTIPSYAQNQPYAQSPQQTQTAPAYIEMPNLQLAPVRTIIAQGSRYKKADSSDKAKTKPALYSPKNSIQTQSPTIYAQTLTRNYDMPFPWINIPSSSFWMGIAKPYFVIAHAEQIGVVDKPYSEQSHETTDYKRKKTVKKIPEDTDETKPKYSHKKAEIEEKADGNESTALTAAAKEQPEQKYKILKKDENQEPVATSDASPKPNYQDSKKLEDDCNLILAYAGTAAGIGLLGLAALASLPFREKSGDIQQNLQLPANLATSQPQAPIYGTIDSVVAPVTTPVKNEIVFNQQLKADLTSLIINEAKQLGYDFSAMSLIKNSTGEYVGIGEDKKQKPAPSLNKVAIAFAAGYLAQQGLLKLDKDTLIDFDPELDKECILTRELNRYQVFKEKGQISYDYLRALMLRESVNTTANVILKYIGNGSMTEGQ